MPDYFDVGFISGTMIISIHLKLTCESFGEKCEWGRKFYSAWCDSLRDKHSAIRKKNKVNSRQKKRKGSSEAKFQESGCESDDEDVNFLLK